MKRNTVLINRKGKIEATIPATFSGAWLQYNRKAFGFGTASLYGDDFYYEAQASLSGHPPYDYELKAQENIIR